MKNKVLFIDRDGTIIVEPQGDFQVDSLEKLEFIPGVISALRSLSGLGYEFVLATNQDGLGSPSFPEETFWPAHQKMLRILEGEGVKFNDQLIDRSFPEDNSPYRKPGTGMFGKYLGKEYDLGNSYVIGDRLTDVELAYNLGAKAIFLKPYETGQNLLKDKAYAENVVFISDKWSEIAEYLHGQERKSRIERKTGETDILVDIDLDGKSQSSINTGLKFFDHMLWQLPHHSGMSLTIECKGDLDVDEHHTIEDVAIALGEAIYNALGSKRGIDRYGFVLPMDESRAMVLLDFGGRADFIWDVPFTREYIGDVPSEMFKHFFKSLCFSMKCNLHIIARGENNHHLIEAVFKGFARTLKMAVRRDVFNYNLPSSKGILE